MSRELTKIRQDAQFKAIVIGKSGAGKSCLLTRYTKNAYAEQHQVTVGVELLTKFVKIQDKFNVKMQIWDTAGQESFRSIIKSYYKNSSVVFLVYNIVNEQSFLSLDFWISEAREHAPPNAIYVLIGTHLDYAEESRQVSKDAANKWMKDKGCALFFETSSKTGENVAKAFDQVAKQLFYIRMASNTARLAAISNQPKNVQLIPDQPTKTKDCCV